MRQITIIGIFLFLISVHIYSQPEFKHFNIEDGFSDISVRNILQDEKGFLWFATLNGLNRYDGRNVKVYRKEENNPNSLGFNRVANLYLDSMHFIWVATYDRSIHRFNAENQKFMDVSALCKDQTGKEFLAFEVYESSKGIVWILSRGSGLLRITETNGKITLDHFDVTNILPNNTIRFVHKDLNGSIWIGTAAGLVQLPHDRVIPDSTNIIQYFTGNNAHEFFTVCSVQDKIWFGTWEDGLYYFSSNDNLLHAFEKVSLHTPVRTITCDKKNSFLVTTQGQGLVYVENNGKKVYHLKPGSVEGSMVENDYFRTHHDQYNKFWIQSRQRGITSFNPETKKIRYYSLNASVRESLGESDNQKIIEDSYQNLWIGLYGGGLCKLNRNNMEFEQYFHNSENPYSISSNYITTLYEDDAKNLWIGTYQGGINKLELKKFPFEYARPVKNSNLIASNEVRSVIVDKFNRTWVGTKAGMIYGYNEKNEKIVEIPRDIGLPDNYLKGNVYELMEDSRGNLWIGTKGHGLYIVKGLLKNEKLSAGKYKVENYNNNSGFADAGKNLSHNDIYSMVEDQYGQVWIATYLGGLNLIENPENVRFKYMKSNSEDPNSLIDDRVRYIMEDKENNLWICTVNGISFLDKKYLKSDEKVFKTIQSYNGDSLTMLSNDVITLFQDTKNRIFAGTYGSGIGIIKYDSAEGGHFIDNITLKDGLQSEVIVSIQEDESGNLWVGTDNGLCKITYEENIQIENYIKKEGIGNNFFSESAFAKNNRNLIFGIKSGFVIFNPSDVKRDTSSYNLWITGLKILNNTPEISENNNPLKTSIEIASEIKLHHSQNFLEFEFAILDYYAPERCRYQYRMKGLNNGWQALGTKNTAVFTDLQPGVYEFQVMATNHDGVWQQNSKTLKIIVQPPFYKTLVFKIALLFLVTLILIGIYLIRVSTLRKQRQYLARQVKERTFEIEKKNRTLLERSKELNRSNQMLAERQIYIEKQKEELEVINENLNNTNTQLEERQQQVEEQSEELKVQAEELSLKNEELETLNATKDKLFSIIAHDLKNPFNSILGFCSIILNKHESMTKDKITHMVEIVFSSTKNVYALLENLLQWSRAQSGAIKLNPVEFSMHDIVLENESLLRNMFKQKNIKLINNMPKTLTVCADQNMINTVVRNLFTNSIKFTENGQIEVNTHQQNGQVHIEIKDSGIGIPEEKMKMLFQIEKAKSIEGTRGEQGSGLGLIICKEFIEKNGGKIYVQSEVGKGTTFGFTLNMVHA